MRTSIPSLLGYFYCRTKLLVFQTFYRYICNVLDLSKKAARSRLSRTLCLTPAQRWQFISCPRVMKTPDPSTTPTTEKQGDLSSESVTQMTQSELINNSDGHGVSDRLVLFRPHLQSAPVSLQGRPLCREQDGNGSRSGWSVRRAEPLCLLPTAHRNGSPRTEAGRTPPSSLALERDIKIKKITLTGMNLELQWSKREVH